NKGKPTTMAMIARIARIRKYLTSAKIPRREENGKGLLARHSATCRAHEKNSRPGFHGSGIEAGFSFDWNSSRFFFRHSGHMPWEVLVANLELKYFSISSHSPSWHTLRHQPQIRRNSSR